MKKLLTIAVCASAVAAFATDVPVSLGEVGVTAVSSSTTNTVIAVSYTDLASAGNITASNLVKTANLTVGDRLYVYDSGDFKAFELALSGSVKYWQGTATVVPKDGIASLVAATSADSVRVAVGTGVWLVRGSGWDGNPFTFYIYGKPVDSLSPVSVSGSALVGNPTQVSKAPTFTSGPTNGDQMIVPYANKLGAKIWKYSSSNSKWWVTPSETSATAPTIPAGTGFWYVGTATFNWN
jgi:hypothetical protein